MSLEGNQLKMSQLAAKLGISLSGHRDELAALQLHDITIVDLLPDMMVMVRSLVSQEEFSFRRRPITALESGLLISFQNVFQDRREEAAAGLIQEQPHVRVLPLHLASEVRFPRQSHIKQITILIERGYLKRYLGKDQPKFGYLFEEESTFWIEDFMTPQVATLVDEVVRSTPDVALSEYYYRLKSLELLYFLFKNLSYRESVPHQPMSSGEIDALYTVRNAMAASLERALPVGDLVRLSGMNEQKLRKLFTQVFGKGLYAYFQQLRIQEAARLLRDERLSVSETGYRLGFTNLSHFGRLFEEHMGVKPKKWSSREYDAFF